LYIERQQPRVSRFLGAHQIRICAIVSSDQKNLGIPKKNLGMLLPLLSLGTIHANAGKATLVVGVRQPEQGLKEIETRFWQVSDPSHPSYMNYLPLDEINAMLSPSNDDISPVRDWIAATGLCDDEIQLNVDTLTCEMDNAPETSLMSPGPDLHSVVDFVLTQKHSKPDPEPSMRNAGGAHKYSDSNTRIGDVIGTPTLQRTIYGIPESLKGTNKVSGQTKLPCCV
jgi:hypothetical protein